MIIVIVINSNRKKQAINETMTNKMEMVTQRLRNVF